jgi:hypothetical protein
LENLLLPLPVLLAVVAVAKQTLVVEQIPVEALEAEPLELLLIVRAKAAQLLVTKPVQVVARMPKFCHSQPNHLCIWIVPPALMIFKLSYNLCKIIQVKVRLKALKSTASKEYWIAELQPAAKAEAVLLPQPAEEVVWD